MNRALLALLASFVVGLALSESPEPTKVRITTWNLEWFPNGSAHDATPEIQAQRIAAAADVLRPLEDSEDKSCRECSALLVSRLWELLSGGSAGKSACQIFFLFLLPRM